MQKHREAGFTYLSALFMLVAVGVGLAAAGHLWRTVRQQERETELLFIGNQFRLAIAQYAADHPSQRYPRSLEALLEDEGQGVVRRYLRKIYIDPMTGKDRWGLVEAPDGGIMGVYSLSQRKPLKTGRFRTVDQDFAGKAQYSEWQFVANLAGLAPLAGAGAVGGTVDLSTTTDLSAQPSSGTADARPADGKAVCATLFRNDTEWCRSIKERYGQEAGDRCAASAQARHQACLGGSTKGLPMLDFIVPRGNR